MYLSPTEVAQSRDHTLHNLLAVSTACIDAGGRLSQLLAEAGRQALAHGGQQVHRLLGGSSSSLFSADFWLDGLQAAPTKLVEGTFDILGSTHTAMLQAAEAQVRVFDQIVFTTIDRARKSSPWEGEIALGVLKTTLKSAENTLHGITDTAIQTVELAESQVRQVADSLAETAAAPARARKSRAKAQQ